ncbi:hypothetical protein RB200_34750 [Streptomyces sp. PmtG]
MGVDLFPDLVGDALRAVLQSGRGLGLDVLRSGRTRPEVSLDDQSADITVTLDDAPAAEELVALGDSVGLALLTVLDSLRPHERLALVPHDVFAVPHEEVGAILGESADGTKMLTSRARRRVQAAQLSASAGTCRPRCDSPSAMATRADTAAAGGAVTARRVSGPPRASRGTCPVPPP